MFDSSITQFNCHKYTDRCLVKKKCKEIVELCKLLTFQSISHKPLAQLKPNMVEMFLV
jgi:hypothetical protein